MSKWTPAEAKKFVEEVNKRAEESARKWHGNKRLNQSRQLEAIEAAKAKTEGK